MRHRVEGRKLKRTASHRSALLRALAVSLLQHKRIRTTLAKAKETRRFAEAIITRAKRAHLAEAGGAAVDVHARRMVARDINDPAVVRELFNEIAPRVAGRPGGYTRVVKLGTRLGDGASLAIIELVDWNTERDESAARTRRKKAAKPEMSRAERVAKSRARQAEKEGKPAEAAPVAEVPAVAEEPAVAEIAAEEPINAEPAAETTTEAADDASESTDEEQPAA